FEKLNVGFVPLPGYDGDVLANGREAACLCGENVISRIDSLESEIAMRVGGRTASTRLDRVVQPQLRPRHGGALGVEHFSRENEGFRSLQLRKARPYKPTTGPQQTKQGSFCGGGHDFVAYNAQVWYWRKMASKQCVHA